MDEFTAHVARHVGGRIRRRRRAMDISQEELAHRAGIYRSRISSIERGRVLPRLDTLILLARALRIAEAQLLAGIDEEAVGCRRRRSTASSGTAGRG